MYKLKKRHNTVMLAPLEPCLNRLREECSRETTVKELLDIGWVIEPCIQSLAS